MNTNDPKWSRRVRGLCLNILLAALGLLIGCIVYAVKAPGTLELLP